MEDFSEEGKLGLYFHRWELKKVRKCGRNTLRTCKTQRQEKQDYVYRVTKYTDLGQVEWLLSKYSSTHKKKLKFSGFLCSFFRKSLTVPVETIQILAGMNDLHYAERCWCLRNVAGHWRAERWGLAPVLLGDPIS